MHHTTMVYKVFNSYHINLLLVKLLTPKVTGDWVLIHLKEYMRVIYMN